MTMNNEVVRM